MIYKEITKLVETVNRDKYTVKLFDIDLTSNLKEIEIKFELFKGEFVSKYPTYSGTRMVNVSGLDFADIIEKVISENLEADERLEKFKESMENAYQAIEKWDGKLSL